MSKHNLDHIETKLLKALSRNDRASTRELASMLPETDESAIVAARQKLEQSHLVEPVPGSTTGQLRLTAAGAETAIELPDDDSSGSGGGRQHFN